MKKVDILAALHDGSMTPEEVSALDDAVMEKMRRIGMSL